MHRDAGGEDDGGGSEEGEEEEDWPGLGEVGAEGSPGGDESAANAAVGFGLSAEDGGAEMEAELDGVDLDEIEVETQDGGDEEDENVAGEGAEEVRCGRRRGRRRSLDHLPCREERGPRMRPADEESEEGDADESPEVKQALMEESAEACGGVGQVDRREFRGRGGSR